MIVFDVVVDEEVVETLRPVNQRLREINDFIHDRIEELKVKYGKYDLVRRIIIQ